MSISSTIAKIGVNPNFIAFNAHCWFAFAVTHTVGLHYFWCVLGTAALKEFWFDATYEVPKQTAEDNWLDFAGYSAGVFLAMVALGLHW